MPVATWDDVRAIALDLPAIIRGSTASPEASTNAGINSDSP